MKKVAILLLLSFLLTSCSDVKITVMEVAYTKDKNYRVVYEKTDYTFGFPSSTYIWDETLLTKDGVDSFILNADVNVSSWVIKETK